MSVTRNVLRGVLRSVTRPVIRAGVISRFFTPLDSSVTQYYAFDQPVVLTGDFDIPFEFSTTTSTAIVILGQSLLSNNLIYLDNGVLKARLNGGSFLSFGTNTFNDGNLHSGIVSRVGSVVSAIVDKVPQEFTITESGTVLFDTIGARSGALHFNGILANIGFSGDGIQPIQLKLDENFGVTNIGVNSAPGNVGTYGNVTAQNISTDSPFYTLNATGTVWTSPDGPDLEIAT